MPRVDHPAYSADPIRDDGYHRLAGPSNFEAILTEPEDRNWYRDGSPVVEELNRLYRVMEAVKSLTVEDVGRIMHASWSKTKRFQGFHHPGEAGHGVTDHPCPKCHADLLPWEALPERQKDINRHAFDAVFLELERRMNEAARG